MPASDTPIPDRRDDIVADASTNELMHLLYDQLHELAATWLARQGEDASLEPTALVHEAYLRLAAQRHGRWRNRTHFRAIAARAMRRVLIDHARLRGAAKRGAAWTRVRLIDLDEAAARGAREVDARILDDALLHLARLNSRHCRVVELRYLSGMSVEETARVLGVSPRTVMLDWRTARAWLLRELGP